MTRRLVIAGWLLVLALAATLPLSALFHGIVHAGPAKMDVRHTLNQPVLAVASDVTLRHGSRTVVVALFSDIRLQGTASDDLVALGGHVYLNRGSHVNADVLTILGAIYRAPHVTVEGRLGGALHAWDGVTPQSQHNVGRALGNSIKLGLAAGLALLLVGTCLTVVFPWQVVLISTTLRSTPWKSGAAGVMALLTFVFLVVPLALSLAGLPFAILLTGAASLAWLFGITASAVVLGRLVARGPVSLVWATAAGLVLLAFGMAVPVIGPVLVTLVGLAGAGALAVALLTRSRPIGFES